VVDQFVTLLPDPEQADRRAAVLEVLTDRELEVFHHIAAAKSNREIATEMHLSEGTVKIHVGHILTKLNLRDRVHAVVLAYESRIVVPD
jgi:DNA-binding NarL/FixJ family response regulator